MKAITINDHKLHEIKMLLAPYNDGMVSYLRYPRHRIQFTVDGNDLVLKIPTTLAVELYRRGVLPQEQAKPVSVKISGKKFGQVQVIDFRYDSRDTFVSITFQRVNSRRPTDTSSH